MVCRDMRNTDNANWIFVKYCMIIATQECLFSLSHILHFRKNCQTNYQIQDRWQIFLNTQNLVNSEKVVESPHPPHRSNIISAQTPTFLHLVNVDSACSLTEHNKFYFSNPNRYLNTLDHSLLNAFLLQNFVMHWTGLISIDQNFRIYLCLNNSVELICI